MIYRRTYLILSSFLIAYFGLPLVQTNAQAKHVAKITHIRVTSKHISGRTTKKAIVTVLTNKNQKLGQARVNKHGYFIVKVQRNLKHANFKLKASKPGYHTRIKKFKFKLDQVSKPEQSTGALQTSSTPADMFVPSNPVSVQAGKTILHSLSREQLQAVRNMMGNGGFAKYENDVLSSTDMDRLKVLINQLIIAQSDYTDHMNMLNIFKGKRDKLENYIHLLENNEKKPTIVQSIHAEYVAHYEQYKNELKNLNSQILHMSSHTSILFKLASAEAAVRSALR